jgi:uncharacterized protein (DUF362 family)
MRFSRLSRREFFLTSAQAAAALPLRGMAPAKSSVGLVHSTHSRLTKPVSADHPLDYQLVREMVWKATGYGKPAAGSLEAKIKPGSWVVVKPNIVFLKAQQGYRTGDVTDHRVVRAVIEYVARNSKAKRITLAEGGSYRGLSDPATDNVVTQDGTRTDATNFDWGAEEFPGAGGSLGAMLKDFGAQFPDKKFDYVDLAYDVVRDVSGQPARLPVPRLNGVGSFSNAKEYFIANTIRDCDFLITTPVAKVHEQCGITACFKSYVGTGPRIAYTRPRSFTNMGLHTDHSVDNRIDPFIADLAAFHPPDYNVVDVIRGLQYTEHNGRQPDQMVRSNIVLAGEDTVATEAVVAKLMGFNPADIDYIRMGAARNLGTFDFNRIEVVGDEPDRYARKWAKPRQWYATCNRAWRVTREPDSDPSRWTAHTTFGDFLNLPQAAGGPAEAYAALARVRADGNRKGFLWMGLTGKATVLLNGQKIMEEEGLTRFRVGQYQQPIELRPGENQLVFRIQPASDRAQLAVVLVGPANDGDSLEGAAWLA